MKRKDIKLEEILRLPTGSQEEMNHALDRIKDRLRSNTATNREQAHEEPIRYSDPLDSRWARNAILAAATFLIAAVLSGVAWHSLVLGVLHTGDGRSHWIYNEKAFGYEGGVLTLRDDSRVEIQEMSVVSLQRAADGVRIQLATGELIVSAAKQRNGHLYVQTKDMTVSVVGTVFFVNAGTTGSRVAVFQGEVQVQQGPTTKQLGPGEEVATNPAAETLPVRDEISWSSHADQHLALLDQVRTNGIAGAQAPEQPEWQKAAGGRMSFETWSVRQSTERDPGAFPLSVDNIYRSTGGVFRASFPLRYYIEFAYKLSLTPSQREAWLSQVPRWVETDNFAIEAKSPISDPTKDQVRLMLQSLLADRFKLALHFEQKRIQVLTLTLVKPGKLGPEIRPHAEGPACPTKRAESDLFPRDVDASVWPYSCDAVILMPPGVALEKLRPAVVRKTSVQSQVLAGRNVSVEIMLDGFTRSGVGLAYPVVDQTGLAGTFDFSLEWTPEDTTTTFAEAVEKQLGMKLEATKAPLPVLIVDHVEKPSEN